MTSVAILDLEVKLIPDYFKLCFKRLVVLKIVRNDISFTVLVYIVKKILIFLFSNMALAAILKNGLFKVFPKQISRGIGANFF